MKDVTMINKVNIGSDHRMVASRIEFNLEKKMIQKNNFNAQKIKNCKKKSSASSLTAPETTKIC